MSAFRVLEALEDARLTVRDSGFALGLRDELATVIRMIPVVSDPEVLLPTEAARRLGVPTRVIIQAMYEMRIPRVFVHLFRSFSYTGSGGFRTSLEEAGQHPRVS